MEDKTRVAELWREIGQWTLTIGGVLVYALVYWWLTSFAADHSKAGNLLLGGWTWIGGVFSFFFYVRIATTHKVISMRKLGDAPFWTFLGAFLIGAWYFVGGLWITPPDLQKVFLYTPTVLYGVALFTLFVIVWARSFKRS